MDTFVCPDQIRRQDMEQSRPSIRGLLIYSLVSISSLLQYSYGFVTYLQSVTVSTLKRKKNMIERIELYTVAIITYESISTACPKIPRPPEYLSRVISITFQISDT
uniref:Uncharacterized protein n=1 Tax=Cacopsylla melanoneura TaxID=428564 RepID=A0A8D9DUV2_9HEMI